MYASEKKAEITPVEAAAIASIKYPAKRKNIPLAGLESRGRIQERPKFRYYYNPHLPPALRSATYPAGVDRLPGLLATARQRELTEDEAQPGKTR